MAETLIRTDLSISCLLFALTWQNGAFWREMLFLPQVTEISLTGIRHGGIKSLRGTDPSGSTKGVSYRHNDSVGPLALS